ncbi:MAG: cytochrome c maturation protein CcmE [Candidatus Kapaibacterium sp.]|jgi:cytochrome c-type biogenesis protein CcmE
MKPRYIIGGVIAVLCFAGSLWFVQSSTIEYTTISKAEELKKRVTVKGIWKKSADMSYDSKNNVFRFVMTDDEAREVPVEYQGSKPNNFELAESIVVKGKMENGIFVASDILTKCPSKYEGTNSMKPTASR